MCYLLTPDLAFICRNARCCGKVGYGVFIHAGGISESKRLRTPGLHNIQEVKASQGEFLPSRNRGSNKWSVGRVVTSDGLMSNGLEDMYPRKVYLEALSLWGSD